jgi:hypothetical protein
MQYGVTDLAAEPPLDADWDAEIWGRVPAVRLAGYLGSEAPSHRPRTSVRLAYREDALHWIFRVEDRYVRATAPRHQARVCTDSCVEFFFVPGTDIGVGYFNVELNCGGTALFHYQPRPRQDVVTVTDEDMAQVRTAASLPKQVDPEIVEPLVWTVQCRLPLAVLRRYSTVSEPGPGAIWLGNFYKCADGTSHPHWLTWSPVDPSPLGFHRPDAFAKLVFA